MFAGIQEDLASVDGTGDELTFILQRRKGE